MARNSQYELRAQGGDRRKRSRQERQRRRTRWNRPSQTASCTRDGFHTTTDNHGSVQKQHRSPKEEDPVSPPYRGRGQDDLNNDLRQRLRQRSTWTSFWMSSQARSIAASRYRGLSKQHHLPRLRELMRRHMVGPKPRGRRRVGAVGVLGERSDLVWGR